MHSFPIVPSIDQCLLDAEEKYTKRILIRNNLNIRYTSIEHNYEWLHQHV